MNEHELDCLIRESIERQTILEDINKSVMAEISRSARKQKIRRWTRIAAFSFGIPTLTAITITMASGLADVHSQTIAIGAALSAAVFAVSVISIICNFSINDV